MSINLPQLINTDFKPVAFIRTGKLTTDCKSKDKSNRFVGTASFFTKNNRTFPDRFLSLRGQKKIPPLSNDNGGIGLALVRNI